MSIENSICEAIETIVNKSVSEAGFDRTIQAVVKSCVDATIGKYKVKYQDSSFYAYATSAEVTYNEGSTVYVLIPGNDMSKDKTILGTVDKLGINYVTQAEGDEAYDILGTNCITDTSTYNLSSYYNYNYPTTSTKTMYSQTVYSYDSSKTDIQDTIVDRTAASEYFKEAAYVVCGATFRTSLAAEQQYQGNYGIIFTLAFKDNATGSEVLRDYQVDVDNMTGNPYKLNLGKRQYGIFEVDGTNFIRIDKIVLFTKDFPIHKDSTVIAQSNLFDIEVSEIECSAAAVMTSSELSGCGISFYTPDGTFFPAVPQPTSDSKLRITAKVKIKGKSVDPVIQKIPFYWFQEDLTIVAKSERYNKYGGRGWRCLNDYNVIAEATEDAARQVEWISLSDTYYYYFKDASAKETKFKCVIVYDGTAYSKTITMKNLCNAATVTIASDSGTQFYMDNGRPTLTCSVDGYSNLNSLTYSWAVEDAYGNLTNLPEDVDANATLNDNYESAVSVYNNLYNAIYTNGTRFANEAASDLNNAKSAVDDFNYIQRINGNKLYKVAISNIVALATYKCTVYAGNTYLGTGSITLTNSYEAEGVYNLVIHNGTQLYKYNEYGVSPASKSLDDPITIEPLSFSVYDNLGNELDEDILNTCEIKWKVPIKDTLLTNYTTAAGTGSAGPDATQTHEYYTQTLELGYGLANSYSFTATDNEIELTVKYKTLTLTASTNFTFVKEGEAGTNGSDYTCQIVPNTTDSDLPLYPTLTVTTTTTGYFNFTGSNRVVNGTTAPFKVNLYKSGECIFGGTATGTAQDDNGTVTVAWSILKNKYTTNLSDGSCLTIGENNGILSYTPGSLNDTSCNIIKCTVYYNNATLGKRYCITATMPVIIAKVEDSAYHINLKDNTGFIHVLYTSDGKLPKYDSGKPFEIVVTKTINNVNETVSLLTQSSENVNTYKWRTAGNQCNFASTANPKAMKNSNVLTLLENSYRTGLAVNQYDVKPTQDYDGVSVNNKVICACYKGSTLVGTIYIPVHLLLNAYGLSQLNSWDGNTVQIDEDGGYILAPQVGAGVKNTDNSFTGVLMGEVQEPSRTDTDIGLLGYNHGTRTFKLDAENGSALFGAGQGQIAIDPSNSRALIYSHSFYSGYGADGLPSSYSSGNEAKAGMIIDLSTPEIRFGTGNFKVDASGYITAKGGGTIAGWKIDDTALFTGTKDEASNVQISSADFTRSINGVSRSALRLALGSKFAVSSDGTMYAGDAIIGTGSDKITIGKSSKTGDTEHSAIYSGSKSKYSSSANGFYLGTDGIVLGSNFSVDNSGEMTAKSGYIGNGSSGWTIQSNYLVNGKKETYSDGNAGVYIGTQGIGLGKGKFYVSSAGAIYAESGTVGGWTLSDSSLELNTKSNKTAYLGTAGLSVGDAFTVNSSGKLTCTSADVSGKITASSGKIGSWIIGSDGKLSAGNVELTSAGTIKQTGGKWSITSNGTANFADINVTSGKINGTSISAGTVGTNSTGYGLSSGGYLQASGASVRGTIYATAGVIGGCTIKNGVLTVDNANIENLDAAKLILDGKAVDISYAYYTYGVSCSGSTKSVVSSVSGGKTTTVSSSKTSVLSSVTVKLLRKYCRLLSTKKEDTNSVQSTVTA